MTSAEKTALENDKRELYEMVNPRYVRITELPKRDGYSLCLQVDVVNIRTWVATRTNEHPYISDHITFHVDVPSPYPKRKIEVYYGQNMWPAHINVFNSSIHSQCIDSWNRYSSLASAVRKTLHCIVFDPEVAKENSMANSHWLQFMRSYEIGDIVYIKKTAYKIIDISPIEIILQNAQIPHSSIKTANRNTFDRLLRQDEDTRNTRITERLARFPSFTPSLLFRSSIRRPGVHV